MIRLFSIEQGIIRETASSAPTTLEQVRKAHWIDAHEPTEPERE